MLSFLPWPKFSLPRCAPQTASSSIFPSSRVKNEDSEELFSSTWRWLSDWKTSGTEINCSSVTKLSDSLWPHGLQHTRLLLPSLYSGVCSNSCPLSWTCHGQMPSNHLILCCCILLPSIFPSIRLFSNELTLYIRWPKYWRFTFSLSPSNEYSGLFPFDFIAVQGKFKNLLQHHDLKDQFFIAQPSLLSNSHIHT